MTKLAGLLTTLTLGMMASTAAADMEQCATDLCGPPSSYESLLGGGAFATPTPHEVKKFIDEEVHGSVKALLDDTLIGHQLRLQTFESLAKKEKSNSLSAAQKAYLTATASLMKVRPVMDSVADYENNQIVVNGALLAGHVPGLGTEKAQKIAAVVSALLNNRSFQTAQNLNRIPYDLFMQFMDMDPNANSEEIRIFLSGFYDLALKAQKELGPFLMNPADTDFLLRISKTKQLSAAEKVRVVSTVQNVFYALTYLDPALQAVTKKFNLSLKEASQLMGWAQNKKALLEQLNNKEYTQRLSKIAVNFCENNFAKALATSPSPLRLRKAQELMERVKVAGMSASTKYFNGAALELAQETISKIRLVSPDSLDVTQDRIRSRLQNAVESSKAHLALAKKAAAGGNTWPSLSLAILFQVNEAVTASPVLNLSKLCAEFAPTLFEDKSLAEKGLIQMGWQSSMFQEFGAGVLAHEMGHVVSSAIRRNESLLAQSQSFSETRTCTAGNHNAIKKLSSIGGTDGQHTEEDWADSFSISTLNELNKTWPYAKNFACSMVSADTGDYMDLALVTSNPGPHSQAIYRALQVQVGMNLPIPASCQEALGPRLFSATTRSCSK